MGFPSAPLGDTLELQKAQAGLRWGKGCGLQGMGGGRAGASIACEAVCGLRERGHSTGHGGKC